MGDGLRGFLDPGRLVFGRARTATELLWAAEEALRTGRCRWWWSTSRAPGLTAVRRLHLAAETGAEAGERPARAPAHPRRRRRARHRDPLAPRRRPRLGRRRRPRWRVRRARARMAPERSWEVRLAASWPAAGRTRRCSS